MVMALSQHASGGPAPARKDMPDRAISRNQLAELLDVAEHASALIDPARDEVLWCSAAWRALFPDWSEAQSWSAMVECSAQLAELSESLTGQTQVSGSLSHPTAEGPLECDLRLLSDGCLGIRVSDRPGLTDSLSAYMQAREHMFTTSRVISVSEMATTLAHEIKQPIATIINLLKGTRIMLAQEQSSTTLINAALEQALEQANFTNSIINRIRDFTQARRPQQQVLDVGRLLREALSLMDWFLKARSCRVEQSIADQPLYCKGDKVMLQQVLVNLLRNGIEAMQDCEQSTRRLSVSCALRASFVRVSIRDNGHGLDGNEQALYVPFSTTKADGMGVGLNICRSFVELHQGRLWLSPNARDGGCTAHVELPVAPSHEITAVHHSREGS